MGSQWGRDRVYLRAAYKLREIQDRFSVIREDDCVVDLGAAPGSWLQVVRSLTRGVVIGVDLSPITPIEGVTTVVGDLSEEATASEVRSLVGAAGVVLSDAAPHLSGQRCYDQARAIALCEDALAFAGQILKPGGNLVLKSFQGEDFGRFVAEVRRHFLSVRTYRSKASRKGSTECYVIAKNFVG
jgi:23S rRNA (uridine2552-2'-O)-methyltransferase